MWGTNRQTFQRSSPVSDKHYASMGCLGPWWLNSHCACPHIGRTVFLTVVVVNKVRMCTPAQWMPSVSLCLVLIQVSALHHAHTLCTYREEPKHGRTVSRRSDGSDGARAHANGGARDAEQKEVVDRSAARVLSSWLPGAWHAGAPSPALGVGSGDASHDRVAPLHATLSAYVDAAHTEGLMKHLHIHGLGRAIGRDMVWALAVRWPQLCGLLPPAAVVCYLLQQLIGSKPSLCSLSAIAGAHVVDEHVA